MRHVTSFITSCSGSVRANWGCEFCMTFLLLYISKRPVVFGRFSMIMAKNCSVAHDPPLSLDATPPVTSPYDF